MSGLMFRRCDFRIGRGRGHPETFRKPSDRIPMTHPAPGLFFDTGENPLWTSDLKLGKAVFPFLRPDHLTTEGIHHELQAIADPQDGDVQIKDPLVHPRAALFINTRRTAGQDDPFRLERFDLGQFEIRRFNLTVNVVFTHPPGNQLIVLGTEVNDQDQCFFFLSFSIIRMNSSKR